MYFSKSLLIGFEPKKMQWQEYLVLVWVLAFLLDEIQMVGSEKFMIVFY